MNGSPRRPGLRWATSSCRRPLTKRSPSPTFARSGTGASDVRAPTSSTLGWDAYRRAYRAELGRVTELIGAGGGGGDYYNTQPARVSKRFARSVIASTLEGQTLYTDAFQMLGLKKLATFNGMGERLELM